MNAISNQSRKIFLAAIRVPREEQDSYVEEACGSDAVLRRRVAELIHAHFAAGPIEQSGATDLSATLTGPVHSDMLGTSIGPYKLREVLGEGGMGTVYVAEQQQPVRRKVALKVIKRGMDSREVIARFEAERQALALMDHPNIATLHDAGMTESGSPYFAMELVNGMPVTEYCDRASVNLSGRLELFVKVCLAVEHAHQKGVIHRDLKPSNLMITLHDGVPVPKVIDFGVAKAINQRLTEHSVYTGHSQMLGTPLYMSPEQAELSGLDVDARSDVYSLGVLLYELLTGTTPFDKETMSRVGLDEMRRMIREDEPLRPSHRIGTLPVARLSTVSESQGLDSRRLTHALTGDLDWIVMKALEKDRLRRYASASALAADVQRYLTDKPVHACPPSVGYRLRKFVHRNRRALTTIAASVLGAIILFTALFMATRGMDPATGNRAPQNPAEHDAASVPPSLARVPGRMLPGLVPEPPLIPDVGRWQLMTKRPRGVIRSATCNRDETLLALTEANHVRIYDLSNLLLLQVFVGHTQPTTSVAWHPDGERLASASEDGTVRLWTKSGVPTHLLEAHTGPVYQVAWRPDGQQLASASADGTVRLWNPEGKLIETLDEAGRHVFAIDWSPDGKQLATVGGDIRPVGADGDVADNSLRIWDADTGKLVLRIPSSVGYCALCVDWRPDGHQLAVGYGHVYRQMHWVAKPLPDAGVRIWNTDGTLGPEVGRDKGSVSTLSWHPDGDQIAFGGRTGIVWIWNGDDQTVTDAKIGHSIDLFSVTWNRERSKLLSTCRDQVRESDRNDTAVSLAAGNAYSTTFRDGSWNPDGTVIAGKQSDGVFKYWSPDGLPLPSPERPNTDVPAWWEAATPTKRLDGKPAPSLENAPPVDFGTKFAWSKDGWLAAASWHDQSVRIWNDQGKLTATCKGHRGGVESVSWSPDGSQVVSGGGDSVRIWNRDGTAGPVMTGNTDEVYGVAWSPDGQWIASGSTDSTVRLWRPDGTAGPVLRGHEAGVFDVSWSPDSKKLVSTSWLDSTLRVWDVASGKTEWQALRLDGETTVTVNALGFPVQGDPDVLDASLLYGVEQRDGTLDLMTPREFRKRHGQTLLAALAARFNKFTEAHELARSESELALALTLRADVDIKGRVQIGTIAEQLASALYFEREYGRAGQAMRTAIAVQEQVVAESPDDSLQKNTLSYRWADLGKVLSAAGRNTEALIEISRAIEIRRLTIAADPEGSKAVLGSRMFDLALRQPTLDAAMADLDQVFELDQEPQKMAWDLVYFLDDLVDEPRGAAAKPQFEIAKAVYLDAIRRHPKQPLQHMFSQWLSSAPEQFRDIELAYQFAQRALELDPGNVDSTESFAWAQYRQGDFRACLATLEKVMGDTRSSDFIRAMAYQSLGNTSEARVAFDRGCQWSNAYIEKVYLDRWSRKMIWTPTAEWIRRLQAEAAAMLDAAEKPQLSAVPELPATATDR